MITYSELRAKMPPGEWSKLVAMIDEVAETGAHYRELIAAYKTEREEIVRQAFKTKIARGGFRHSGSGHGFI